MVTATWSPLSMTKKSGHPFKVVLMLCRPHHSVQLVHETVRACADQILLSYFQSHLCQCAGNRTHITMARYRDPSRAIEASKQNERSRIHQKTTTTFDKHNDTVDFVDYIT
eukprot:30217-Eustigmatos_ZCMA.PRE.1